MAIFNQQSTPKKDTLPYGNEPTPAAVAPPAPVAAPLPPPREAAPAVAEFSPSQTQPPRAAPAQPELKESLIAADLTIEGKIEGSGHVRIAGKFKGDVNVQGDLSLERGAKLTGGVRAKKVTLAGELEGNVDSAQRVDLLDSAALTGDVKAGSLTVAAGSKIRGHIECGWGDVKDAARSNGSGRSKTDAALDS